MATRRRQVRGPESVQVRPAAIRPRAPARDPVAAIARKLQRQRGQAEGRRPRDVSGGLDDQADGEGRRRRAGRRRSWDYRASRRCAAADWRRRAAPPIRRGRRVEPCQLHHRDDRHAGRADRECRGEMRRLRPQLHQHDRKPAAREREQQRIQRHDISKQRRPRPRREPECGHDVRRGQSRNRGRDRGRGRGRGRGRCRTRCRARKHRPRTPAPRNPRTRRERDDRDDEQIQLRRRKRLRKTTDATSGNTAIAPTAARRAHVIITTTSPPSPPLLASCSRHHPRSVHAQYAILATNSSRYYRCNPVLRGWLLIAV